MFLNLATTQKHIIIRILTQREMNLFGRMPQISVAEEQLMFLDNRVNRSVKY